MSVSHSLYEPIQRHGYFFIQIIDQGQEFVNSVFAKLHCLTVTIHLLISIYHRQANDLVERQSGSIKSSNSIIKRLKIATLPISHILQKVRFQLIAPINQLWSKFQSNPTLFAGVIAQNPLKLGPIESPSQKNEVYLPGKVENGKYPDLKTCPFLGPIYPR